MAKENRKFTPEEKVSILQESEREGVRETCRKYNLASSLLSYWRSKYLSHGKEGLKPAYRRIDPQVRELELENDRLKKIIAKMALEMEVKEEVIKKSYAHMRKGNRS